MSDTTDVNAQASAQVSEAELTTTRAELIRMGVIAAPGHNFPRGRWLTVVDRITRRWLECAILYAGTHASGRDIGVAIVAAFDEINAARADVNLPTLVYRDIVPDAPAGLAPSLHTCLENPING